MRRPGMFPFVYYIDCRGNLWVPCTCRCGGCGGGDDEEGGGLGRNRAEPQKETALGKTPDNTLEEILEAVKRLDDGDYGICEECGDDIGVARLKARPGTTLCVVCKSRQEEGEDVQGS